MAKFAMAETVGNAVSNSRTSNIDSALAGNSLPAGTSAGLVRSDTDALAGEALKFPEARNFGSSVRSLVAGTLALAGALFTKPSTAHAAEPVTFASKNLINWIPENAPFALEPLIDLEMNNPGSVEMIGNYAAFASNGATLLNYNIVGIQPPDTSIQVNGETHHSQLEKGRYYLFGNDAGFTTEDQAKMTLVVGVHENNAQYQSRPDQPNPGRVVSFPFAHAVPEGSFGLTITHNDANCKKLDFHLTPEQSEMLELRSGNVIVVFVSFLQPISIAPDVVYFSESELPSDFSNFYVTKGGISRPEPRTIALNLDILVPQPIAPPPRLSMSRSPDGSKVLSWQGPEGYEGDYSGWLIERVLLYRNTAVNQETLYEIKPGESSFTVNSIDMARLQKAGEQDEDVAMFFRLRGPEQLPLSQH